jgi:hypothetical protein
MAKRIQEQNASIEQAMFDNPNGKQVGTNLQLCKALGIAEPSQEYWQNYAASDIKVTVI